MKRSKKIVLSNGNLKLLKRLAEMVDGEAEVVKDPNFALSLLLSRMRERPSSSVMRALLHSLEPNVIEHRRGAATRKRKAA